MRSSSLPLKHRVVSNLVNNIIMSFWFDRKESFDGEKTSARVMRACDGNPITVGPGGLHDLRDHPPRRNGTFLW